MRRCFEVHSYYFEIRVNRFLFNNYEDASWESALLTRLEVDGFKNLIGFSAEFGPFTCIAGPNGVGKSNVFDAIQFLSLLADNTLIESAQRLRGATKDTADIRDLFWTDGGVYSEEIRIAAEMIVNKDVVDDFGRQAKASSTFLRYEITLGYEGPGTGGKFGRLVLRSEDLTYITEGEAPHRLRFPHNAKHFRKSAVKNKRKAGPYISTERSQDGVTQILVHQEGRSGNPQRAPADSAPRTIVATANTSSTPTILAARREMQCWSILSLEPTSMRGADRFQDDPHITPSGDHLPATVFRLAHASEQKTPEQVYSRIASTLSGLVPIKTVSIEEDDIRQLFILVVEEKSGVRIPARSLSDGTLRFLTLSILRDDPESEGLICMEEPENGIHPEKIRAMVKLLKQLVVDVNEEIGLDNNMRQLIIATHSPYLVQLLEEADLLFAMAATIRGKNNLPISVLRCRPLCETWRCGDQEKGIGLSTILAYLSMPAGAQLSLPDFGS